MYDPHFPPDKDGFWFTGREDSGWKRPKSGAQYGSLRYFADRTLWTNRSRCPAGNWRNKKKFQDVSIYFMTGTCIFHNAFVLIDELCSVSYQFWRVASSCAIMEHEPFQRSLDCFAKDRTLGAEGQDTCMFSWLVYNQSNGHWQLLALDWTTKNCIQLLYFWTYSLFQNHPRFTCWMLGAVFVYGNLFAWTPTWYCIDKLSSTISI